MSDERHSFFGFVCFVAGAAIGAGLALLYAPQTGVDTRKKIKDLSDKVSDDVKGSYDKVSEEAKKSIDQVRSNAEKAIDNIKTFIDGAKEGLKKEIKAELKAEPKTATKKSTK